MKYTVYILFSVTKNKYYIGFTGNEIKERLRKHNSNHNGFTGCVGDWKVVYHEYFEEKSLAQKREIEIKKWKSRKLVENLVASASLGHSDF